MGTWGIARDMAKRNEQNLANLKKKGTFSKLKDFGSYSTRRLYKYKKATPELLESIKEKRILENNKQRRKNWILAAGCVGFFLIALWLVLTI